MTDVVHENVSKAGFRHLRIFGAGGSGREVAWLAKDAWGESVDIGFMVDRPEYLTGSVNGFPVSLLVDSPPLEDGRYLVALGDPALRERFVGDCNRAGHIPTRLLHPRIEMSRWVEVGFGTVIYPYCVITSNVLIGDHVQINVASTISHDVIIGDYSTLSPGVHIAGNVQLGRGVFVGTSASIINGSPGNPLNIGDGAVIAAGACVTEPVPTGAMVAGVPAIRKR